MRPNGKVVDLGLGKVMYVNDRHGFSVEMLTVNKRFWSMVGFRPAQAYVENEIEINAPASEVWTQLADHANIGNWSTFSCKVLRPGGKDPDGIGCVRELAAPGMRLLEEVTAWDEGRHYAYQLRSGAPFRTHQGDIFVTEDGQGRSRVRWAIRFDCWIPFTGKLIAWLLEQVFKRDLRKLKSRLRPTRPASAFEWPAYDARVKQGTYLLASSFMRPCSTKACSRAPRLSITSGSPCKR